MFIIIYLSVVFASSKAQSDCLYKNISKRLALEIETCLVGTRNKKSGLSFVVSISQQIRNISKEAIEITYIAEPEFRNRATIYYENTLISGLLTPRPTDGIDPNYKPINFKYFLLSPGESKVISTKISEILPAQKEQNSYSIFFDVSYDFRYASEPRGQILKRMREEKEIGEFTPAVSFEGLTLSWE